MKDVRWRSDLIVNRKIEDWGSSMLAIPVFRSRVAPVLNWCSKICIISGDPTVTRLGEEVVLFNMNAFERLRTLHDKGVNTLICGALSPDLLSFGEKLGLNIIHGVAGGIHEVVEAYHEDRLHEPRFWLPGCQGPQRCRQGVPYQDKGGEGAEQAWNRTSLKSDEQNERAADIAAKRGPESTAEALRGKTDSKSGPEGSCICPRCGVRVRQERGVQCMEITCPHCDYPMAND